MLVRVNEVIVRAVVEEYEAEADGKAAKSGTNPGEAGIGRPCEDEEADGDEPAGEHHGYQADFSWWVAVVLFVEFEVMFVD